MHRKSLAHLLKPNLRLCLVGLALFALAAGLAGNWPLAGAEAAATLALAAYFRWNSTRQRRELLRYIDKITCNVDVAAKDTMLNAPLPMVLFRPENGEVIWSNDRFLHVIGEREHLFDRKLSDAVPDFSSRWLLEGKTECPTEVRVGARRFFVFGHLIRTDPPPEGAPLRDTPSSPPHYLAMTNWVDVTGLADLRDEYYAARPVAAILALDNYEEIMKGQGDNVKSALLSSLDETLCQWTAPMQGIFTKYDRDRYLFVFEARHLQRLQDEKFSVLDAVHRIHNANGIPATLSIGIGRDADTFQELFQYAALSLDMSLSRGGDQAVIKNKFNFEFYGGRTKETEKRTKVKSRVMANALSELSADASRVLIMGHKFSDLDCIGAAAGLCAIARKRGVDAHIVTENQRNPSSGMVERLGRLPQYQNVFVSAQDAMLLADSQTLLAVVDTNRPEQTISEDLLLSCNKIAVIDHHRRAATYIANAALNFHEPYASSASELVTELLQYLIEPSDLLHEEANALLAGITLDTKQFTMRTGGRTFEAAAFLRRCGAETSEVKKLFQNNLDETIARYDILRTAKIYREQIAVAAIDHTVGRITAAQAADELLNISGIDTSFVLFPDGDRVIISGRSMGGVNVQVVLEKIGGGGNAAVAGGQIPGTLPDIKARLFQAIDQYFQDEA